MQATFEQDLAFFEKQPVPGVGVLLRYTAAFTAIGLFIGLCGLRHAHVAGSFGALFWLFLATIAFLSRRRHLEIKAGLERCERLELPRTATVTLTQEHLVQATATTLTTNAWTYFDSAVLEDGELRFLHKEVVYRRIPVEALDDPERWLAAARQHIQTPLPLQNSVKGTHEGRWSWTSAQQGDLQRELREHQDPGSTAPASLTARALWAAVLTGIAWCSVHPPVAAVLGSSVLSLPILAVLAALVGVPVTARWLRLEHVNQLLAWLHSATEHPDTPLAAFASPDGLTWRGPDGDHFTHWTAVQKATFTENFVVFRLDIGQEVWAPQSAFSAPEAFQSDVTTWLEAAHATPTPVREPVERHDTEPTARDNPFAAPET